MIEIGHFSIRFYGLIVGFGILVGFWVASRLASKFNIEKDDVWDALLWMAVPGVVGARIYHVIASWSFYRENLQLIPAVWNGGLGIFGAIVGGSLGLLIFVRRKKISFLSAADLAAFGMPVGQAIGRWGNFFNQELYGWPTNLPWGLPIRFENRIAGYERFTHFHPLFLYESLWSVLTFGVLLLAWKKWGRVLKSGSLAAIYLMFYGIGRFFLEGMRIESWVVEGVAVNRLVSLGLIILGILLIIYSRGLKTRE